MFNSRCLGTYIKELKKIKVLKKEETLNLIREYNKTKDETILKKIVEGNLRLVMIIAKNYRNKGLDYEELINEGNIGLISGIKKFNTELNVAFSYYVAMWIRQGMLAAIAKSGRIVSIPFDKFTRSNKAIKDERHGKEIDESHKIDGSAINIDKTFGLSDTTAEHVIISSETEDLLKVLTPTESFIIRNHYGIGGCDVMSLTEISQVLSESQSKISNLRDSALMKMKKILINN